MRKITNKDIENLKEGTKIFDFKNAEWLTVTKVYNNFCELGLIIETKEDIKSNYWMK